MTRLLPSRSLIRRAIATLWVLTCVWLLVRTLLLRNASPHVFADAEYLEQVLLFALSCPLCGVGLVLAQRLTLSWWPYPGNDSRTILAVWLYFFVAGCL